MALPVPLKIPIRIRKLIGVFVLLLWIFVYSLFMMGVAVRVLPNAHWAIELLFYAVAGLAWIFPVRYLFQWMNRPDEEPDNET